MSVWDFTGKRVIISGCFSGMGEAAARELVRLGAEVHGFDYKRSEVPMASFTEVDLREPASIDAAVAKVGGSVDALFNCAGLAHTFPPLDLMKVNFIGLRHLTETVLPLMKAGGSVTSISSNGGLGWTQRIPVLMEFIAQPDYASAVAWCESHADTVLEGYGFSKEVLICWTLLRCYDLVKRGIRINCTLPGPTDSPMMKDIEKVTPASVLEAAAQPSGRRSTPAEQAYPLIFLGSDAASYISGLALNVDLGFLGSVMTGQIDMRAMMGDSMDRTSAT